MPVCLVFSNCVGIGGRCPPTDGRTGPRPQNEGVQAALDRDSLPPRLSVFIPHR